MRWSEQLVQKDGTARPGQAALFEAGAQIRTFDTPGFRDSTFYEVRAKSVLNRIPGDPSFFHWTVNPYRGCGHRCVYCFARKSHTYLDFDAGLDFDTRIVVKVNAPEVLRRELARPSWQRELVAMGTNVDCYQRAEGRYRLMPEIIAALADSGTPLSILTKGTLLLRDLPLLQAAAREVKVSLSMSIGFTDETLWRSVEPGTPSPARRLDTVRALADAGLGCSVLMAPILPYLSDTPEQLRATVAAIAQSGAKSVTPLLLHLRPGAREWYAAWLKSVHPQLVPRYRALYRRGSYAPSWYSERVVASVRALAAEYGLGPPANGTARGVPLLPEPTGGSGPGLGSRPETGSGPQPGTQSVRQPEQRREPAQLSLWGEEDEGEG